MIFTVQLIPQPKTQNLETEKREMFLYPNDEETSCYLTRLIAEYIRLMQQLQTIAEWCSSQSNLFIFYGPVVISAELIKRKHITLTTPISQSAIGQERESTELFLLILVLASGNRGCMGISWPTASWSLCAFNVTEEGTPTFTLLKAWQITTSPFPKTVAMRVWS